jgi:XTP/dITP diphosphohydrolase
MRRLVLASANPDKTAELERLLEGSGFEVVSIAMLRPGWEVDETGDTLAENALLKARAATAATGLPAVADDTGLFVDVLGGAPGIYTARFAGVGCSYADNVRKLLVMMARESNRRAWFRTVVAFCDSSGGTFQVSGEVTGTITRTPAGESGFGYDPVFLAEGLTRTFAACSSEEKRTVSHRSRAMTLLRNRLQV